MSLSFQPFTDDHMSRKARKLADTRNSKIELTARVGRGLATVPLPVAISDLSFEGIVSSYYQFFNGGKKLRMK